MCFCLGTYFLLFKCHRNSREHEIRSPRKEAHGFIWNKHEDCAAHRSHYGSHFYFCPNSYTKYGLLPKEQLRPFSPQSPGKCPVWPISLLPLPSCLSGGEQAAFLSDFSNPLCFHSPGSGLVLSPKFIARASPAHWLVPTIMVHNHIFSFPATLWRGSLPPGQHGAVSSCRARQSAEQR